MPLLDIDVSRPGDTGELGVVEESRYDSWFIVEQPSMSMDPTGELDVRRVVV